MQRVTRAAGVFVGTCLLLWPAGARGQAPSLSFSDATLHSGIDFVHEDGADQEGYLVSLMGSGLGLFDYDRDGRIDAYFLNGRPLPPTSNTPQSAANSSGNALYRNLGGLQFANVSAASRSDALEYGLGVAVADMDQDGFQDIALANFGSLTLLRNAGDGTFTDVTAAAGLSQAGIAFGAGVAWLDMEGDGDLDLYVADYVDFDFERFARLAPSSYPYPPGPEQFTHRADHLFRNHGDGTFSDCSLEAGIADYKSPSMGVVCGDFDGDHDTDIFVCSDARPNLLFINDGQGHFTQDAELLGVAYTAQGIPVGSMGAEAGDIDNDGAEDLFITDYSAQMPILFRNLGEFGFEDASVLSRAGRDVVPHANWGAGLADLDNDGDRDLLIGNGHLLKWAQQIEQLTAYKVRNCLLSNDGAGRFTNVTDSAGSGLAIVESTRGLGLDDLDNDGDIDVVVLNHDAAANVLENQTQSTAHWLEIQLVGSVMNRDGIGAKVTVECAGRVQVAEMRSGRGYQSSYGSRLHFGLGNASEAVRVTVDWLGTTTLHDRLPVDQVHLLYQKVP